MTCQITAGRPEPHGCTYCLVQSLTLQGGDTDLFTEEKNHRSQEAGCFCPVNATAGFGVSFDTQCPFLGPACCGHQCHDSCLGEDGMVFPGQTREKEPARPNGGSSHPCEWSDQDGTPPDLLEGGSLIPTPQPGPGRACRERNVLMVLRFSPVCGRLGL